ncbi:MAG: type IA DNA topoisomerase [Candidatus Thalassarchaeaceae archaeon]|nr:type IA DNA topoisomerase [Candidatus Thalassarchaeaceae archaeon]
MDMLIVESSAKSKTIQKYLGKNWIVEATGGHVQDLPNSKATKDGKKAMWACTVDTLPNPPWEYTEKAERTISKLLDKAKKKGVDGIYIATDPDREGEFIAWRLAEIFNEAGYSNICRISFHEITKPAILEAISERGSINDSLVDAAKVRRFMDRLVGFRSSKFSRSWNLAAMGRVQTPTLGFIVERELEREAFVPIPYYAVHADAGGIRWNAIFHDKGDADAWVDDKGKFHSNRTNNQPLAQSAFNSLASEGSLTISSVDESTYQRNPKPPFTTDTLLMSIGSEKGWNPRRTMRIAGELYNAGHITYIRTDSTRTSASAREEIKTHISEKWGDDHLGKGVLGPDAKSDAKNVQDAHEAIRPTRPTAQSLEGLSPEQKDLYQIIWARFAGSQMSVSKYDRLSMTATTDGFERNFTGTASWRVHRGWEAAFEGIGKEPATQPPAFSATNGTNIALDAAEKDSENPCLREDETKPPARYKQHSLVQKMKAEGIGRPSTYATTIDKLISRKYVIDENNSLSPSDDGRNLWLIVVPHYERDGQGGTGNLFSTAFTAEMEGSLDGIENNSSSAPTVWHTFSEHFQALHQVALDRKKLTPTPKQAAFFKRITAKFTEEQIATYTGGKKYDDITGGEMREILEKISKDHPMETQPASDKQKSWIASMAGDCNLSEEDASALVDTKSFDDLTGGRKGTASKLIEILQKKTAGIPRPPTEKQLNYITKMAKIAEMDEASVCQLINCSSYSELLGGKGGTASQLITILQKKTGSGKKRRGKKKKSD